MKDLLAVPALVLALLQVVGALLATSCVPDVEQKSEPSASSASTHPGSSDTTLSVAAAPQPVEDSLVEDPGAARTRPVEIGDSAGVRVVINGPAKPDDDRWRVLPNPSVQIGLADGPEAYLLARVSGGVILADGTVVILNGATSELRFYDAKGTHLRSAARSGQGPGELIGAHLVGEFRDSLLVEDIVQQRMSVFDSKGTFARSYRLASGQLMNALTDGVLSDGRIVVTEMPAFKPSETNSGYVRTEYSIKVVSPAGENVIPLGAFPGLEEVRLIEGTRASPRAVVFGRGLKRAALIDRIALGTNDQFSIRVYDAWGTLSYVVRQEQQSEVLIGDAFEEFVRQRLDQAGTSERRSREEALFNLMPRHTTFPAFSSIKFDRTGNLWVEEYRRPAEERSVWQIFDTEGVLLSRVELPSSLEILDIGEDYILGLVRDQLGVERVNRHELVK